MLLAFDVGNTHVVFGLYEGSNLLSSWRLQSDVNRTVDEYALEILGLVDRLLLDKDKQLGVDNFEKTNTIPSSSITAIVICCVVPPLTRVFSKFAQKYFGFEAIIVGAGSFPDMPIYTDNPHAVGADRLVNAYSARESYGYPAVIIDMGTATTFDIVGKDGAYEGGIIAPGLNISAQALFSKAAMLPSIEIKHPQSLIGKNTTEAMLSGIVYGYVGLVDGIVMRLRTQLSCPDLKVIGTGGLVALIADDLKFLDRVVPDLTLRGLRLIAKREKTT